MRLSAAQEPVAGGVARARGSASRAARRARHGASHRRSAGNLQERKRQHADADRRLHLDHRQGQGQRGHPHRGASAARRALRAGRRQGGRDQGLQRGDRARCVECARLLQPRQRLRPARPARSCHRRLHAKPSSSMPPTRTCSTIAARSTTPRATTSWRSPTIPNRYASSATTRAPSSTAAAPTISWASTIAPSPTTREAIKLDATDPDVFNNRGQAYDTKGDYDLAIADYSQSIRLSRDNPRAFFNRAVAYANKDEYRARDRRFQRGHQARSARCRGLLGPRRHARGARQRGRRARGLSQGPRDHAGARGCQGGIGSARQLKPTPSAYGRIQQRCATAAMS